jgi:hypothetical protein
MPLIPFVPFTNLIARKFEPWEEHQDSSGTEFEQFWDVNAAIMQ